MLKHIPYVLIENYLNGVRFLLCNLLCKIITKKE